MDKIIVFGVGDNFVNSYHKLKNIYNIVGLIDNSVNKQGLVIDGIMVKDSACINQYEFEFIVITPNSYLEIIGQLINMGIDRSKIMLLKDLLWIAGDNKWLRIAFNIIGDASDYIIALNYIYSFLEKYKTEKIFIDIYGDVIYEQQLKLLFDGSLSSELKKYINSDQEKEYDLFIDINNNRYPEVKRKNTSKIIHIQPKLIDYIQICEKFRIFNQRFYSREFVCLENGIICSELDKRKRIGHSDIYSFLGIKEDYRYIINIVKYEESVLNRYGLIKKKYLTINRGEYEKCSCISTKLWPLEFYDYIIQEISSKYTNIDIVLLNNELSKNNNGNLKIFDKLSAEELKIILKNSLVHLDNDSLLVHLRYALHGGKSIVLFGPTSKEYNGYSKNINMKGAGCNHWCEHILKDWEIKCAREFTEPPCMKSILPSAVLREIEKILEGENIC